MTTAPSVLGLSEAQLQHFQTAFKLSYHLNYFVVCQQFVPLRGLDVLEVGGALPASLVIDHLGCNSWTAVEAPGYDQSKHSTAGRAVGPRAEESWITSNLPTMGFLACSARPKHLIALSSRERKYP